MENVKCVRRIKCVKVHALLQKIKCISHARNKYAFGDRPNYLESLNKNEPVKQNRNVFGRGKKGVKS